MTFEQRNTRRDPSASYSSFPAPSSSPIGRIDDSIASLSYRQALPAPRLSRLVHQESIVQEAVTEQGAPSASVARDQIGLTREDLVSQAKEDARLETLSGNQSVEYLVFKRIFDVAVTLVSLILFLPVMLAIGLAIVLESKGGIIFKQSRVGRDGKLFTIYKFRTMYKSAPSYAYKPENGCDSRITRVGRLLRKTSLDELPQLINVLKGDMSLVGPRPEMPFVLSRPPYLFWPTRLKKHLSYSAMTERDRGMYTLLTICWITANLLFWVWWLQPSHVGSLPIFLLFSLPFAYDASFLPSMYLFFVGRMRQPHFVPAPSGLRVALITLCVPAKESLDVIARQLEALVLVEYPHDSWVLDEGNDPTVRETARRLGVKYFTRSGITRYNQPKPPFMSKTKAGNVNAWLDAYGSEYDAFVQLDIDHRPRPNYLDRVLGYFSDPKVAWVQGPSLYGNLDNWIARGAAEQELVLQGPLQMGFYGFTQTPFIIGSHCTYRMSAVLEIGGFQPTRAEDHLDTVVLATHGYRGVFVPEALAVGNGPDTFETYLQQQFAWAYSMMQIMFGYGWKLVRFCNPRQILQFLFAQTWYAAWSTSMLVLFALPIVALLTGLRPSIVDLPSFAIVSAPMTTTGLLIWLWTRKWQLPEGLTLSWRGILLHVARWPIVFWALINVLLRVKHPYMITPKGMASGLPRFSLQSQVIYLTLSGLSLLAIQLSGALGVNQSDRGYALFAILGAGYMLSIVMVNVTADLIGLVRRGLGATEILRLRVSSLGVLAGLLGAVAATLLTTGGDVVSAATWHTPTISEPSGWLVVLTPPSVRSQLGLSDDQGASDGTHFTSATADASGPSSTVIPAAAIEAPIVASMAFSSPSKDTSSASNLAATSERSASLTSDGSDQTLDGATLVKAKSAKLAAPLFRAVGTGAVVSASILGSQSNSAPSVLPPAEISVGVYSLDSSPHGLKLVEWFVSDDRAADLTKNLQRLDPTVLPIITIESDSSTDGSNRVLEEIVGGKRDVRFRELAHVVRTDSRTVLIRWGHEMDLVGLYPWSVTDDSLYRAAYRHVIELFRAEGASNVRWLWSPAGNAGALAYYPGDDVVDYVGLTVLGDAKWDALYGLPPQTFTQLLSPRYDIVKGLGKPIVICELGVSGTAEYQRAWLADAVRDVSRFPMIRAIVYFDAVNAANNHYSAQPDWRIDQLLLQDFARQMGAVYPLGPVADTYSVSESSTVQAASFYR